MSLIYAETSAVLRWILGAPLGEEIRNRLIQAQAVVTSRLTLIEARRSLTRASALNEITPAALELAEMALNLASAHWAIVEITPEILDRAAARFPAEPVRTLDAVHLATAAYIHAELGVLTVVSTDDRVVRNARLLGMSAAP